MLGGFSIFRSGVSMFYILMHFVGCVMLSFFITESWHYVTYWYIFAFCSAAPALLELWCAPRPRASCARACARARAFAPVLASVLGLTRAGLPLSQHHPENIVRELAGLGSPQHPGCFASVNVAVINCVSSKRSAA